MIANKTTNYVPGQECSEVDSLLPESPILFVDDSDECLSDISRQSEDLGCPLMLANSISEAKELVKDRVFSGLCIDLRMGEESGLSLLADISYRLPDTPIVIVSQYRSLANAITALKLGARDFLLKPLKLEEIIIALFSETSQQGLMESIVSESSENEALAVGDPVSLELIENEHIRRVVMREKSISKAAKLLQLHRTTLFRKKHLWDDI